jgi:hypothetical protein
MRGFFIISLLLTLFLVGSCRKKQESLAKTETLSSDSLFLNETSDEVLNEFEYEADSLIAEEVED